jgi:hypothetical protein
VRMVVPPVRYRRDIDKSLASFFRSHRPGAFRAAVSRFCRYYRIRPPRIEWYEYIDWGKTAGKTYEDGRIHLIHPENWKRGRIYKSERMWIQTLYHEMGHYLFWTDAERKADSFQRRMVLGLRPASRRTRKPSRTNARRSSSRRAASMPRPMRSRAARASRRRR